MSKHHWLIVECREGWKLLYQQGSQWESLLVSLPLPADRSPGEAIAGELFRAGYRGEATSLALRTENCFSARFKVDDASLLRNTTALMYEFEHWMPMSAEEMVADYSVAQQHVLGVATAVADRLPLLEQLAVNDVHVGSISCFSLLALQSAIVETPFADEAHWVIFSNQGTYEAVHLLGQRPTHWIRLSSDVQVAAQALRVESEPFGSLSLGLATGVSNELSAGLPSEMSDGKSAGASAGKSAVWVIGEAIEYATEVAELLDWELQANESIDLEVAAVASSNQNLVGESSAWIEFRRGGLFGGDRLSTIRRSLNFAILATGLGLLLAIAGLGWRTQRNWQRQLEHREAQERIFAELHPGSAIPPGIRMRLASEAKSVASQQQLAEVIGEGQPPLLLLQSFLKSVPDDVLYRIGKVVFQNDGKINFDAELKNRADAEALRNGLVLGGFDVVSFPTRFSNDRVIIQQGELRLSIDQGSTNEAGAN